MSKNKFIGILSILLLIVSATFTTIEVQAQSPLPNEHCVLVDASGAPTSFSVDIEPEDGVWPFEEFNSDVQRTVQKWRYRVNGLPTGTQVAILVPVGDPTENVYSKFTDDTVIYPSVPAAELSTNYNGFGVWAATERLITINSIGGTFFSYGTDTLVPRTIIKLQFKSGKNYYYCPNIAGSGEAPPFLQYAMPTYLEVMTDPGTGDNIKTCFLQDPYSGCNTPVDCETKEPLPSFPLSALSITTPGGVTLPIVQAATAGACTQFMVRTPGTNTLYNCTGGATGGTCTQVWPRCSTVCSTCSIGFNLPCCTGYCGH